MRPDGKLIIVAPLKGSPAGAAGVRPGDIILEVDGESILGLGLLEAVGKIRGPRGSEVRLLVLHLGDIDPVEIVVTRDVIPLTSVLLRSEPGAKIAHIRLTTFYADTASELANTLREVIDDGAEGLILDVRDNPGGLLQSVVDVVSQFVTDDLVLYEVDGSGRRTNWKVRKGGAAIEIPMVVLTNEFSASASEILAGALQDHGRATIIGASTFGKGSVNVLKRLSNGGGLYLTFARWYTPSGRLIHGNGVEPDIEVVARDRQKAETLQLEKAIEVLESKIGARVSGGTSS
jgi:carboxyl-terminal processing protease